MHPGLLYLLEIDSTYHTKQAVSLGGCIPLDACRSFLNQICRVRIAGCRGRQVPPKPTIPISYGQPTVRTQQRRRTPCRTRFRKHEIRWDQAGPPVSQSQTIAIRTAAEIARRRSPKPQTGIPALTSALEITAKSVPSREFSVPHAFSKMMSAGALPSFARATFSRQNDQKVPDCLPLRPTPLPVKERSWQGKDARAEFAVPGRSADFSSAISPAQNDSSLPICDVTFYFSGLCHWQKGMTTPAQVRPAPCRPQRKILNKSSFFKYSPTLSV